jgi:predicted RNase H-like HicB family nuclease
MRNHGERANVPRRSFGVGLMVVYTPAGNSHVTVTVPALPGTISTGKSQAEARENVLDALAEMLSTEARRAPHARAERLRVQLSFQRLAEHDLGQNRYWDTRVDGLEQDYDDYQRLVDLRIEARTSISTTQGNCPRPPRASERVAAPSACATTEP